MIDLGILLKEMYYEFICEWMMYLFIYLKKREVFIENSCCYLFCINLK